MDTLLNQTLLADNHCFGCGHANPHGLHIEVQRDPDDPQRLIGRFQPTPAMIGFPGITHGGCCTPPWIACPPGGRLCWVPTWARPGCCARPI